MKPGSHGSTFGGNPLACAAALAVIETIDNQNLIEHAASVGTYLIDGLKQALGSVEGVREIRGAGLMIGIELSDPCIGLVAQGIEKGILFSVQSERVIRLLPPLIIDRAQADAITDQISALVKDWLHLAAA
jgi:acetylornithine aminotransferase